jgi:hypothetical protein
VPAATTAGNRLLVFRSGQVEDSARLGSASSAALFDERITLVALGGAMLVATALLIAHWPRRRLATA